MKANFSAYAACVHLLSCHKCDRPFFELLHLNRKISILQACVCWPSQQCQVSQAPYQLVALCTQSLTLSTCCKLSSMELLLACSELSFIYIEPSFQAQLPTHTANQSAHVDDMLTRYLLRHLMAQNHERDNSPSADQLAQAPFLGFLGRMCSTVWSGKLCNSLFTSSSCLFTRNCAIRSAVALGSVPFSSGLLKDAMAVNMML